MRKIGNDYRGRPTFSEIEITISVETTQSPNPIQDEIDRFVKSLNELGLVVHERETSVKKVREDTVIRFQSLLLVK